MVHARHRLCPLATVGCAAVCLTETQLSLVSGSCNGRGGSLRERRLSPAARRPSAAGALISRQANQSSNNRTFVRTTLMNINQDPPSSRRAAPSPAPPAAYFTV